MIFFREACCWCTALAWSCYHACKATRKGPLLNAYIGVTSALSVPVPSTHLCVTAKTGAAFEAELQADTLSRTTLLKLCGNVHCTDSPLKLWHWMQRLAGCLAWSLHPAPRRHSRPHMSNMHMHGQTADFATTEIQPYKRPYFLRRQSMLTCY
eukprot:1158333-Pelagomonas_calceolata.AAC.8